MFHECLDANRWWHGAIVNGSRKDATNLGASTVTYDSSVNWLVRCFDYYYDCDSYAWRALMPVNISSVLEKANRDL